MRTPTDTLRDEHRGILHALEVLEAAAGQIASGGSLPEAWWKEMIGWLRALADRNHHGKEKRC